MCIQKGTAQHNTEEISCTEKSGGTGTTRNETTSTTTVQVLGAHLVAKLDQLDHMAQAILPVRADADAAMVKMLPRRGSFPRHPQLIPTNFSSFEFAHM